MYTADELEIRAALAGSPRADELIACLEGEIAKRDEELAACRVAVENCEAFRARIAELESRYQRDVYGLNNEGDPIGGDPAGGYANDNARLRAELSALKAHEPSDHVRALNDALTFGIGMIELNSDGASEHVPAESIYAAPVSEAKAQGVVMPERKQYPSQSTYPDGKEFSAACGEVQGFNRCLDEVARLNAATVLEAKAQGVVMPEPDIKTGHGYPAYSVAAVTELFARLNAAPVQQVVPDASTKMQWPEIVALVNEVLGCEAHKYPCERGSIGHEMTGINFNSLARIIDRVRYAAAPAAPAADAGMVEALKQAFPLFDEDGLNELYHHCEIAVLGDRKRLHKLLAAHSAKGVV